MTASSSNLQVGAISTANIFLNRSRNVNGGTITASTLPASVLLTLTFDSTYSLLSNTSVATYSQYSINTIENSIGIVYSTAIYGADAISVAVSSYLNPIVSGLALPIYAKITDPTGNTLYDQAQTTLTFSPITLSNSNDISWGLSPATVSTISNLSLSLKNLRTWSPTFSVEISLMKYWSRSVSNTTLTATFGSSSTCTPTCAITSFTQSTLVKFTSIGSASSSSVSLLVSNLISPPTTELADLVNIVVKEPTSSTIVMQTVGLYIGAFTPNPLQLLTTTTST